MSRIHEEEPAFQKNKSPIVICADDFGQSTAIDDGIRRLVDQRRLSAVSCLSEGPRFAADIANLLEADIDLGLHLNFTEAMGRNGLYFPLASLIARSYLGALNRSAINKQISRQLDVFEQHAGRAPDFVDGHQHVHQLPVIREALLKTLQQRYPNHLPWLRHTRAPSVPKLPARLRYKAAIIGALGANKLEALARRDGFLLNPHFLGIYDFSPNKPGFATLLKYWLSSAKSGDVLMCHPARAESPGDVLGRQRVREYEALTGELLANLLDALHLFPARFGRPNETA